MNIRPCPADRTRALARLRKGRAGRVRRVDPATVEVLYPCGCVVEVDFGDPVLATLLQKKLKHTG